MNEVSRKIANNAHFIANNRHRRPYSCIVVEPIPCFLLFASVAEKEVPSFSLRMSHFYTTKTERQNERSQLPEFSPWWNKRTLVSVQPFHHDKKTLRSWWKRRTPKFALKNVGGEGRLFPLKRRRWMGLYVEMPNVGIQTSAVFERIAPVLCLICDEIGIFCT